MGRCERTSAPSSFEDADQEERRGDAVGVVVAVDGDRLAALQRFVEALPSVGHAGHEVRVVDAVVGMEKRLRRGGVAEAAAHEDLRHDLAHAELRRQPVDVGERRRRDVPGAGIDHEYFTARVYRGAVTDVGAVGSGARRLTARAVVAAGGAASCPASAGAAAAASAAAVGRVGSASPATVTAVCSPASVAGGAAAGVSTASRALGGDPRRRSVSALARRRLGGGSAVSAVTASSFAAAAASRRSVGVISDDRSASRRPPVDAGGDGSRRR